MDGQIGVVGRAGGRGFRLGIDEVTTPAAAKSLNRTGRRAVIVHAGANWIGSVLDSSDGFWPKLVAELAHHGIDTRVVRARSKPAEALIDPTADHVHVVMGDIPGYGRNMLHVDQGHIPGFWYLDEVGVGWHSSVRLMQFCPERVNFGHAEYFFNGVSGWMLRENVSKAPQTERMPDHLEPAAAVIFAQDIEGLRNRAHFMTNEQMIRTAAEHDRSRLIYVKLHPRQSKASRRDLLSVAQDYQNVQVSEASVHDLIEKSRVVVTQNSSAGFEALMQKKTVVTCAKADYRHATLTAKNPGDLSDALDYGPDAMADFPFEKYFYWFLGRNLLEEAKDNFAERAVARIREKAFL
ncbi:capsular polysaccharide export protein, LipB/KpsS family [Sinisalibacter aestuarii]|uniref:Capsular biosynthesis protein n=1 Tax=Sinisalibacter aestuarii TaxID=2949426 RepID=A0ABQ5LTH2_9RHOB|nr:hypothetical protein [Sinisalibacter aestuarii]GKY88268.1 hypothetical protein STA1M1_21370 [Sinisalibacter aestuarii]